MGTKKKLGLGVASAALGLALVGGGTWAAFNDIETTQATYAAGTLDLNQSPIELCQSHMDLSECRRIQAPFFR